ncbi:hypothetical protein Tco_0551027 [Tanacetum coccineum]
MAGDENKTPHESAAFKAFQRRNGPPVVNKVEPNPWKKEINTAPNAPKMVIAREQNPLLIWPIKKTKKKATHFEAPVVIPNGDSIPVKGKGDYILTGGTKVNGVLYILDFKCSLLSVSRLSRDLQCCISLFLDFCVMQGLQRKNLIGEGRCEGGLYRMKMVQGRRAMTTTVETWHKRTCIKRETW